jgi:hypothetical protein
VLHLGLLNGLWMAKRYALGSAAAARAGGAVSGIGVMRQQQASFLLAEGRTADAAAAARSALTIDPSLSASRLDLAKRSFGLRTAKTKRCGN